MFPVMKINSHCGFMYFLFQSVFDFVRGLCEVTSTSRNGLPRPLQDVGVRVGC